MDDYIENKFANSNEKKNGMLDLDNDMIKKDKDFENNKDDEKVKIYNNIRGNPLDECMDLDQGQLMDGGGYH